MISRMACSKNPISNDFCQGCRFSFSQMKLDGTTQLTKIDSYRMIIGEINT